LTAKIVLSGVKDTIRTLNKMDKELAKEFRSQVDAVAAPVLDDLRAAYNGAGLPLSGMAYAWGRSTKSGGTAKLFPYNAAKAASSVRIKYDTRRNAIGVVAIIQRNPAAAIFEVAGRKNINHLDDSLDQEAGRGWKEQRPTRILGPVVYKSARSRGVTEAITKIIDDTARNINVDLRRI
jgi:hypothetical protein